MSKQVLQMKYHPAKKEVEFSRFQSGTKIQIRPDSKLVKYVNKRGSFVLQDHGNTFLADIAETFDGEKIIDIEVITTKIDYEDFEQMVEYFNNDSPIRVDIALISELPDMESTYRVVKTHGEKSVGILEKHKAKFFEINMHNPYVKQAVEGFAADIQKEVYSIKDKIDAIAENNVNLCFAGVYSSGKSALINAILGYTILPENINSETARMFRIQSPKSGENVRIVFAIRDDFAELIWDEGKGFFEFAAGPVESASRKSIQDTVNKNQSEPRHKQIHEILKVLNSDEHDVTDIKVFFPVPLDNDRIQFTIYDTPGTDSNYGTHQTVLQEALSEQTHSILIFVAKPDGLEGEGNNALLNYIKEAEKKDSKTSIDMGRSLFVINKADTLKETKQFNDLQIAKITSKEDENFSIHLIDKKLFFTSAMIAYAAKAQRNGIATESDDGVIEDNSTKVINEKRGRYYKHNRFATSEHATVQMVEKSVQALNKAENAKDNFEVLHICSGLFALENEITLYGEKFAAAVRAYAIIDSVDKALSKMNKNAQSLEKQNLQDINNINNEIEVLRDAISESIKKASLKHSVPQNEPLPKNILQELHLDQEYLSSELISMPISFFEKLLKGWFFGLGEVKVKDKHKQEITQKLTSVVDDFTRNFLEKRQRQLENQRDLFIETVKEIIHNNGKLNDEAKSFVLDIRTKKVKKPNLTDFEGIYDAHKRTGGILWKTEFIDKKNFIQEADGELTKLATGMAKDFTKDYKNSLESILSAVKSEFEDNLEKYSVLMKAKLADKETMEKLRVKILEAATELMACQKELNKIIWSEKSNEQ
jgi:hypothetical protein